MPAKIPLISITVRREGGNYIPPIGKPYDFTDEEVEQIMHSELAPVAFRDPIVEKLGEAPYRLPEGSEPLGATRTATASTAKTGTKGKTKPADDEGDSL